MCDVTARLIDTKTSILFGYLIIDEAGKEAFVDRQALGNYQFRNASVHSSKHGLYLKLGKRALKTYCTSQEKYLRLGM